MSEKCAICCGLGTYPIHDQHGQKRYDIQCPECSGVGEIDAEVAEQEEFEFPPSTAARIKTWDDLKQWERERERSR